MKTPDKTDMNQITKIINNVLGQNGGKKIIFNIVMKNNVRVDDLIFKEVGNKLFFTSLNGASLIIDPNEIKEIKYYAYEHGFVRT